MAPLFAVGLIACTAPTLRNATETAAGHPVSAQAGPVCGDLLAMLGKKPTGVTFVGCGVQAERQGKPLRALYRVPSAQAAAVEDYLVAAVGLARLRRSCCQWDGPAASFRGADGRPYMISMTSAETTAPDRASWSQATAFQIVVETPTEEI